MEFDLALVSIPNLTLAPAHPTPSPAPLSTYMYVELSAQKEFSRISDMHHKIDHKPTKMPL